MLRWLIDFCRWILTWNTHLYSRMEFLFCFVWMSVVRQKSHPQLANFQIFFSCESLKPPIYNVLCNLFMAVASITILRGVVWWECTEWRYCVIRTGPHKNSVAVHWTNCQVLGSPRNCFQIAPCRWQGSWFVWSAWCSEQVRWIHGSV